MVSPPSDAEVIARSLDGPEACGLIYDRHAAALLCFLGRRAGARVAEGLRIVNELRDYVQWGHRTYEALDPEGHRCRFHQRLGEATP